MIFTGIINALYYLVYAVTFPIRAMSDVSLPASFQNAVDTMSGYLSALDIIIPVDTILIILKISVTIEGAYLAYKLVMWLVKRFPTQS